jgi:hypothetical protein
MSFVEYTGLYDSWRNQEGVELYSFVIITVSSCKSLQWLHNRMPVILDETEASRWIKGGDISLLKSFEFEEAIHFIPVTKKMTETSNLTYTNSPVKISEAGGIKSFLIKSSSSSSKVEKVESVICSDESHSPDSWSCSTCTFINESADSLQCAVCAQERNNDTNMKSDVSAGWKCSRCTFFNSNVAKDCIVCEATEGHFGTKKESKKSTKRNTRDFISPSPTIVKKSKLITSYFSSPTK